MTRTMLDFVRQGPARFTTVDLAELARETLDFIAHELRNARIKVSLDCSLDTPPIWGDRARLQQVLLNLFTNAIQAMKNGGHLTVRIAQDANPAKHRRTVLLSVEDTGPGISPEAIKRIFDFFFTTKMGESATGLGLAISRQIIERHGGTITAENIESGGARMALGLPAAIHEEAASA